MSEETVTDLAELGASLNLTGAETTAPAAPAAPLREKEVDAQGRAYATGRRKESVARVWIKPGTGKITVPDYAPPGTRSSRSAGSCTSRAARSPRAPTGPGSNRAGP